MVACTEPYDLSFIGLEKTISHFYLLVYDIIGRSAVGVLLIAFDILGYDTVQDIPATYQISVVVPVLQVSLEFSLIRVCLL